MSIPWFHLEDVPEVEKAAALDAREAKHAAGARRLAADDEVCLFDGRGTVATALLERDPAPRGRLVARVIRRKVLPPPPPIHLASALPKGDRQKALLNMATQIGMRSFIPLECERSVARWSSAFTERSRRVCLEACKQSRRAHLPSLRGPMSPVEAAGVAACAVLAHPGYPPIREVLRDRPADREVVLLVGPEGGFTDSELGAIESAGGRIASLGDGTLRIETAAVVMLSYAMLAALPPDGDA